MAWTRSMGKGRLAALIAVLALVLQAMSVAPAHAGSTIELCTPQGKAYVQVDKAGHPVKHKTAAHCGLCVLHAPGDMPSVRSIAPVRYAVYQALTPVTADAPPAKARGPPRPFGQGPPLS